MLEGEGVIEQRGRDPLNLRAGVMVLSEPDADDTAFIHQAKNLSDTNRLKTLVLIIHDEGIPPAEPLKN